MTKGEQAGLKFAAWVHRHPVAAKAILWAIVAAAMTLFISAVLDIASKGNWIKSAITFAIVGLGTWRATRKTKVSND